MKKQFLFIVCLLFTLVPAYAGQLAKGEGRFTFTAYAPFADRPVEVHYYIPPSGNIATMPVIFVMQGADRGVGYLTEFWKKAAEERKFIFILPHFDLDLYPLADYQETGVLGSDRKTVKDPSLQTSALIDEIFFFLQKNIKTEVKKYSIYGHSAGGQFIQRFMLFYDSPYVEKAIIASPGWYTLPDADQLFPYGVNDIPYIDKEVIRKYLAKKIILQLGKADTIRESYLRKTPEAELQGRNRLERGRYFYEYITELAKENNWTFNWQKKEEEGIGHNSVQMADKALPTLFKDSLQALFIGNSYTFYNQMPEMVKALASSNGDKLSVRMMEHGGWTLQRHVENKETLDMIKEGGWDFVILQEQSQAPSKEKEWVEEHVYPPARELDKIRKTFNPAGKTIFYMTWGHNIETYQEMQQRIAESYTDISKQLNAGCAPVGIAWKRVRNENPAIQLYDPDKSHPSLAGSYLAANVFYSVFYQKPYRSDYYAGLSREEAIYLQRIAQEVVFSNPGSWNLRTVPQPEAVKNRFYSDPEKTYTTPTLHKPLEEGLASLEEIRVYLQSLVEKYPDKAAFTSIGTTTDGRMIPILYLTEENKKKKTKVWLQAALHGNEPAGPEAICMLTDYLLNDPEGNKLLSDLEIALIPVANPDGYALQNRRSVNGIDLNRDQSKYADPVSTLLKQAYIRWNPDVALDIHEYTPWRKDYDTYFNKKVAIYEDVLFLPTGHPNIPEDIRNFSVSILQKEAGNELVRNGYTHSYYFTPKLDKGKIQLVKAAKSPQSSSTSFGLSNTISMFIEIRGIGLGRESFARRAGAGLTVAKSMLHSCLEHQKEISRIIGKANKETVNRKQDISVSFTSPETVSQVRFVDFLENDTFSVHLPTLDNLQTISTLVRKRPVAYLLTDTCRKAVEILETVGLQVERTGRALTLEVEKYIVTGYNKSTTLWEGIYPLKIQTQTIEANQTFPPGTYIVYLNQPNANYAVTFLEPESENGFIPFNVIEAKENEELPVYRLTKKIK